MERKKKKQQGTKLIYRHSKACQLILVNLLLIFAIETSQLMRVFLHLLSRPKQGINDSNVMDIMQLKISTRQHEENKPQHLHICVFIQAGLTFFFTGLALFSAIELSKIFHVLLLLHVTYFNV